MKRVERVLGAARMKLAGVRPASAGRTCTARRRRGRSRGTFPLQHRQSRCLRSWAAPSSLRRSCRGLLEHLGHPLGEPGVAACVRGLRETRTRDEYVVVAWADALAKLAPRLAQLPLDPVSDDRVADRPRHGQAEPRLARRRLPRAETSRGRGSASRPSGRCGRRRRSPGSGTGGSSGARCEDRRASSGREPLAALGPATLQDRLPGAGSHARTEAVLALATTDVGLIGALQRGVSDRKAEAADGRGAKV